MIEYGGYLVKSGGTRKGPGRAPLSPVTAAGREFSIGCKAGSWEGGSKGD